MIFVIGSRKLKKQIEAYTAALWAAGHDASNFFPIIKGLKKELSVRCRMDATLEDYTLRGDQVHVIWDGHSIGTHGDICVALREGCSIIIIFAPIPTEHNPATDLVEELRAKSAKARLRFAEQIREAGLEV